ncbi:hypothetical protein [Escherichia coli]|nr:hypothetical protein [Escherichia coli]MDY8389019.1 hypothetical protein [Escherichia coli]
MAQGFFVKYNSTVINKADHEMLITQEQEAFIKQQKEAEPLTFD